MTTNAWAPMDPDDICDYKIDWASDEFGKPGLTRGDPLTSSMWIVPDGINVDSESFDATSTTIWVSGGTLGQTYTFVNRVTTAGGRTFDKICKLKVKER